LATWAKPKYRFVARSIFEEDPRGETYALVTSYSDVVAFLKLSETDLVIGLVLIAIGVESEYRSISISLSGWNPTGEPNAPITAESEMTDLLRLLNLIWRPNSSIIAIGVEPAYRSVARSLSRWGPKGKPNAPIAAESKITDSLKLLMMIQRSDSSMLAIRVKPEYRFVARSLSGWGPKGESNALIIAGSKVADFLRRGHSCSCSFSLL
jgi:hypothetical protein